LSHSFFNSFSAEFFIIIFIFISFSFDVDHAVIIIRLQL
jgi:hypothetical protein